VAGGVSFHVVANYSPPVISFGVDSFDIVEQTNVHEPWHYHSDSPISGDYYGSPPYSVCSSPPTGYQNWVVCQLNVPFQTFSFHNTSYVITANYHYIVFTGAYPPSPSNPMYSMVSGSISLTANFQNLIVEAQPKILKWDPNVPENCDTTFSYTLSCAQKKNCNVTIKIYSTEGNLVYQTNLTQLCPGTCTFTWDGTNNQLPPSAPSNIAPAGLYTFDIQVQGACPYDQDSFRSGIIKVTQTSLDVEESQYKFGYYIESTNGTLPSEVKVTVYGPAIDNFKVYWGPNDGSKNLGWNYVYFPKDTIKVGEEHSYVVVSGMDSDVVNKAHKFKPFLERNQNPKLPTLALFYANYEWVEGGRNQQGEIIWVQQVTEAARKEWSGCLEPAGILTKDGAFQNPPPPGEKPNYTVFATNWINKDTNEPEYYITAAKVDKAVSALKSVNVFAFAGHGDGNSIEFREETEPTPYRPYLTFRIVPTGQNQQPEIQLGVKQVLDLYIDSYNFVSFPQNTSLSNLHLLVIGSCRRASVGDKFPIAEVIQSKGAKYAIGVGGKVQLWLQRYDMWQPVLYTLWNFLYSTTYQEWAKRFWEWAAKGRKKEDGTPVWPTMGEAADSAAEEANKKVLEEYGKQYPYYVERDGQLAIEYPDFRVYVYKYGQDDYLGNIKLEGGDTK